MPKKGDAASDLDPSQGFGRFTQRARNVVMAAHNETQAARHAEILPAHLVLGPLAEPESIAAGVLLGPEVTPDALRTAATARCRRQPRRCPS